MLKSVLKPHLLSIWMWFLCLLLCCAVSVWQNPQRQWAVMETEKQNSWTLPFSFSFSRATTVIGYLPQEVLGTSCYEYFHQDDLQHLAGKHRQGDGAKQFWQKYPMLKDKMCILSNLGNWGWKKSFRTSIIVSTRQLYFYIFKSRPESSISFLSFCPSLCSPPKQRQDWDTVLQVQNEIWPLRFTPKSVV